MKDLARDWRRWSRVERILGLLIAVLMISIPLAFSAALSPGSGSEPHTVTAAVR